MTPADPRRIRLVSEAVVASYIHDISARTGSAAATEPARRHGAEQIGPRTRARRAGDARTSPTRVGPTKRFDRTAAPMA